jgi:hypothetical protein
LCVCVILREGGCEAGQERECECGRVTQLAVQVPWKCDAENEDKIKAETKATIRCYPFEHNQSPPTGFG